MNNKTTYPKRKLYVHRIKAILKRIVENLLSVKVWIGIAIFTLSTVYMKITLDDMQFLISKHVLESLDEPTASVIIAYMTQSTDLVESYFKLLGSAGIGLAGLREVFKTAKLTKNGNKDDIPV